ncbi:phosphoribosyltransferase [Caldiplasma sukawensis]
MKTRARLVEWNQIEKWCEKINSSIPENDLPDTIIGLSRGGLVPARLISDYMQIKDLFSVKTEHWGLTATKDGKAKLKYGLNTSLEGKNVLIVDDITDTGESMRIAKDYISTLKPSKLRTATMLHIDHSAFIPDYFGEEVTKENWAWFIFPWNVYEDLVNLIGKLDPENMTSEDIAISLKNENDLKVSKEQIEKVLNQAVKQKKFSNKNGKYSQIKV